MILFTVTTDTQAVSSTESSRALIRLNTQSHLSVEIACVIALN